MKIVINGRFLNQDITGVQRYGHEVIGAWDSMVESIRELDLTVLSPKLSGPAPKWRNIAHQQVGSLRGHPWEQIELPYYSQGAVLFCPCNTAPIFSLIGKQKVIVTVHDLSYRYFPEAYSMAFRMWYGTLIPLIMRRATAVLTVSQSERDAILQHYPFAESRLAAVQCGVVPAGFEVKMRTAAAESAPPFILYAGSLSKRKNFPGALEAACRLVRKRGFHFVFAGGVARGLVESDVKIPQDVAANITLAGRVDDATLFGYYQRAACFLFPSFYEASPLPPMEAMTFGCPVIASDIPSLRERCGGAAVYCNPADIESIVAAVERVMDDGKLRENLKELGFSRAANYSWKRCAAETLRFIRDRAER